MDSAIDLTKTASLLPDAWRSQIIDRIGSAQIKVLRMDGTAHPEEQHPHPEAFVVINGMLCVSVAGEAQTVKAGELLVMPPGTRHAVCAGSHGVLLIIDLPVDMPSADALRC